MRVDRAPVAKEGRRRMSLTTIGIDPGNSGAIAVYDGRKLEVFDMPVVSIKKGKSTKNRVDAAMLVSLLTSCEFGQVQINEGGQAFVEQVGAMPGQGVTSMFTFGRGAGIIEGALAGLKIPYTLVAPQRWRKGIGGMDKGKDASRARAAVLFPRYAHLFAKKKDNGKAEAALIAMYGRKQLFNV
jgi:crossover junction endodeoxyribonuclease RuvC